MGFVVSFDWSCAAQVFWFVCVCVCAKRVYKFSSLFTLSFMHTIRAPFNAWTTLICNITEIDATIFFPWHNQEWISSFLVWSVQSIIFIDSSGCLCLIQPSNKKWKIYRDRSLKSAKVPYCILHLNFEHCQIHLRILENRHSTKKVWRSCKCSRTHTHKIHIDIR